MLTAFTHKVSPAIGQCELTFVERAAIDYPLAERQHTAYCAALERCGANVRRLEVNLDYPDACFIEDTAFVTEEVAVITRPGAASRRGETKGIAGELSRYRPLRRIEPPATLEGGDLMLAGRTVYIGISRRTTQAGYQQLAAILEPFGYRLAAVPVHNSLHLKTACTLVDDETLLINPNWVDTAAFNGLRLLPVPAEEGWAANTLRVSETLLLAEGFRRTAELLAKRCSRFETVDISELRKAEGGLTCLSLLFTAPAPS